MPYILKSLIIYPLKNGNDCLGVLEVASRKAGVFNRINANLLSEITPLLEESIYRYGIDFENQINAYIQTEYTSLHPSVEWKFRQKAKDHLLNTSNTKQKSQISFQNVYPMYGEIDVRNSSTIRNQCMRIDYQNQIEYLIKICGELYNRTRKEKFLDNINHLQDFLDRIDNVDKIYSVEKIFRRTKADEKTLLLIQKYNEIAQDYLKKINVPDEKKKPFIELANYLLRRES